MKPQCLNTSASIFALIAALGAPPALAQETADTATLPVTAEEVVDPDGATQGPQGDTIATERQLETIVVTARRQQENLQTTPVSVSALSSTMLDEMNVQSVSEVSQLIPNLSMPEASGGIGGNVPFIRGIGSQEPLLTIDSPVGVYIDGVYLGRHAANNFDLVDPERVEVLRGPQGTLFGRNTTGGAVNVITRIPSRELGAEVKAGYASYDHWYARGVLDTGEWGDSGLSAILAVMHRERDGFQDNPHTPDDRDPGALKSDAAWGKIHGEWGALRIDITGDWNEQRGDRNPFQIVESYEPSRTFFRRSPSYGGDPFIEDPDFLDTYPVEDVGQQYLETFGLHATAEYEISRAIRLKSISAWRGWDAEMPTNYAGLLRGPVVDFTSPTLYSVQRVSPFAAYVQDLKQRQFSQEFQVLGNTDTLSYVAGAYYYDESVSELNENAFTIVMPPAFLGAMGFPPAVGDALAAQGLDLVGINLGQRLDYSAESKSLAGFAQVSWRPMVLDQRLELTGGLRYTHDERTIDQPSIAVAGPITGQLPNPGIASGPSRDGEASFNNWSYLASVNFQWTPQIMTYARYSTGYKSGGFDARAGIDFATGASYPFTFEPEEATAYEIGFKSEFLDRSVRLNGAAFYTDYSNLQIPQYSGGSGFVPNADAHYQGFELELMAIPIDRLQLDASLGYVDPVYDEFLLIDPATGIVDDYSDVGRFPYVPKWTFHLGGQYSVPVSLGMLTFRGDYSYSSRRYFFASTLLNPLNAAISDPGQNLLSARVALSDVWIDRDTELKVSLFGENLLNEDIRQAGIDFGSAIGIAGVNWGEPRRFGIDVTIDFR